VNNDVRTPLVTRICARNADALEQYVAEDLWPLPKYREMLPCGV
jgi:glutamine synthetase type III